jgi:hypothetical protein
MWRLFGELSIQLNFFQNISNIGNFLNENGGNESQEIR